MRNPFRGKNRVKNPGDPRGAAAAAGIPFYEAGAVSLLKDQGFDPERNPSNVCATFDLSPSVEGGGLPSQFLYSGKGQPMIEAGKLACGAAFALRGRQPLKKMPAAYFHRSIIEIGTVHQGNCETFLDNWREVKENGTSGTSYIAAMQWMAKQFGYRIDMNEVSLWATALRTRDFRHVGPLRVKATSKVGNLGILATDGDPTDDEWTLIAFLYVMSQYPIFVVAPGVGRGPFKKLLKYDKLPSQPDDPRGRLFDNFGSFDSAEARGSKNMMLNLLLGEYPERYKDQRNQGLIVA